MNRKEKKKAIISNQKPASGQPRWNKKGKMRTRDLQGETGMKRAKWHLKEKGGKIKGDE